jgi:hypothetical protein
MTLSWWRQLYAAFVAQPPTLEQERALADLAAFGGASSGDARVEGAHVRSWTCGQEGCAQLLQVGMQVTSPHAACA